MAITTEWDVYMSGALSALSPEEYSYVTSNIYERVQNICQKIRLTCYLPHQSQTTPNKGMPHAKVWEIDYKRVVNCGALIAYVGMPSCGVGAEIEMARTANVPVILLFESKKQEQLSRLVLGNPTIKYTIPFNRPEEIDNQLTNDLIMIFSEKNLDCEAFDKDWSFRKREGLRKQLITIEKAMQSEGSFRNLDAYFSEPISKNKWYQLGQDWEKKSSNKNGRLDDFPQS